MEEERVEILDGYETGWTKTLYISIWIKDLTNMFQNQ